MKRFLDTWPMLYWSRKHTMVLFVAMLSAVAALLMLANYVGD